MNEKRESDGAKRIKIEINNLITSENLLAIQKKAIYNQMVYYKQKFLYLKKDFERCKPVSSEDDSTADGNDNLSIIKEDALEKISKMCELEKELESYKKQITLSKQRSVNDSKSPVKTEYQNKAFLQKIKDENVALRTDASMLEIAWEQAKVDSAAVERGLKAQNSDLMREMADLKTINMLMKDEIETIEEKQSSKNPRK